MLTDYHMHLQPDGVEHRERQQDTWGAHGGPLSVDWMRRYVERARSRAISEIAFTEHVYRFAETRDWHDDAFWREEATEDADAYVQAVLDAKAAGLPVLLGVEMDWLPHRREEIARFLEGRPFDVVLGSVHWLGALPDDNPSMPPMATNPPDVVWGRYLDELVAAARSGLYDVLAHPDLPKVFGHHAPPSAVERFDEVIAAIAATGVAIECSSAGLRKPVGELYPEPTLLGRFRAAGVPVTLASDAHRPEEVGEGFPTAVAALRGAGYETLTRFSGRTPEQVPLASWG